MLIHSISAKLSSEVEINNISMYLGFSVPFRYKVKEGSVFGEAFDYEMGAFNYKIYISHRCKIDIFKPPFEDNLRNVDIFHKDSNSDIIIQIGPNLHFTRKERENYITRESDRINKIFKSKLRLYIYALLLFETGLYYSSQDFGQKTNGIINQLGIIKNSYGITSDKSLDINKDLLPYMLHQKYTSLDFIFSTFLNEINLNKIQLIINEGLYPFDLYYYKGACALGSSENEVAILYLAMAIESAVFTVLSYKLKNMKYKDLSRTLGLSKTIELISELYSLDKNQWENIKKIQKFLTQRNKLFHVLDKNKLTYIEENLTEQMKDINQFLDTVRNLL